MATFRVSPVRRLLTDNLTSGTAAPEEFVTVPWSPPLVCANSEAEMIPQAKKMLMITDGLLGIVPTVVLTRKQAQHTRRP